MVLVMTSNDKTINNEEIATGKNKIKILTIDIFIK